MTDHDLAERFRAMVVENDLDVPDLAKYARCTKDGAKHWVKPYDPRCPSLPKVLQMGRALACVQQFLMDEMGCGRRDAESGSAHAVLRIVTKIAIGEGPDAMLCRAILRQAELKPMAADVHAFPKRPPAPSIERQTELFELTERRA